LTNDAKKQAEKRERAETRAEITKERESTRVENRENRRMDIASSKLERARFLAEKRMLEARKMLEAQLAALEKVNQAVLLSETDPSSMLMDAVIADVIIMENDAFLEELESEETAENETENAERNLRFFGFTKEIDRFPNYYDEEFAGTNEMNVRQQCRIPEETDEIVEYAEAKFEALLEKTLKNQRNKLNVRSNLNKRLLQRYSSVLKLWVFYLYL
jgi:2-hydroxychromene-2-carboxylate isomerase